MKLRKIYAGPRGSVRLKNGPRASVRLKMGDMPKSVEKH